LQAEIKWKNFQTQILFFFYFQILPNPMHSFGLLISIPFKFLQTLTTALAFAAAGIDGERAREGREEKMER